MLCTLLVAGWKHLNYHRILKNLHRGWLSQHRGPPVNIPIWRIAHLFSVIPANDTMESMFHDFTLPGHLIIFFYHKKEEGNDQEMIRSSSTPDQGHHMGKWQKYKKTSQYKRTKRLALVKTSHSQVTVNMAHIYCNIQLIELADNYLSTLYSCFLLYLSYTSMLVHELYLI